MPRTSKEVTAEIDNIDPSIRLHWLRLDAARMRFSRLRDSALVQLTLPKGGEDFGNSDNSIAAVAGFTHSDQCGELAKVMAVIHVLESSPLAAEVERVLVPLRKEQAEAFERESNQRHETQLARNALVEAEKAATEKFLSRLDSDPAVKKAREALAGIKRLGQPLDPEPEDIGRELAADLH